MTKKKTTTATFDALLADQTGKRPQHVFRLFLGGTKPNSIRALQAIKKFCEEHLPGRYHLETIDIFQDPAAAREHQIVAVPALIRLEPPPVRRFVGDFTAREGGLARIVVTTGGDEDGSDGGST
jgi:circadian clock protein KaiB